MADTYTAHYNLTKPEIGGDPDTWGTLLNANMDAIDTAIYNVQTAANNAQTTANNALPLVGGTLTGALHLPFLHATAAESGVANTQGLFVSWNNGGTDAPGATRFTNNQGGGTGGFVFRNVNLANSQETGRVTFGPLGGIGATANITAGGNIIASGSVQGTSTTGVISGATGSGTSAVYLDFAGRLASWNGSSQSWGPAYTIWHSGNFNPGNYAALNSSPAFSGNVYANGNLYAGGTGPGAAIFQTNGDVQGGIWGGYLSNWLNNNVVHTSARTYTHADGNNTISLSWDGNASHINITVDSTLVAYVASNVSDERAKKNIAPSTTDALARVNALRFVEFDFIDNPWLPKNKHIDNGVVAQQARRINPNWVVDHSTDEHPDAYMSLDLQYMLMDAMRAIQQLSAKVTALEAASSAH